MNVHHVTKDLFEIAFNSACKHNKRIVESCSNLNDSREGTAFYLSSDTKCGFALYLNEPYAEVCYVFSAEKGRGNDLVNAAVTTANRLGVSVLLLDCFDGYLVNLYKQHKFNVSHREQNWAGAEHPDVVHMIRLLG